jgi:hypothetical protein
MTDATRDIQNQGIKCVQGHGGMTRAGTSEPQIGWQSVSWKYAVCKYQRVTFYDPESGVGQVRQFPSATQQRIGGGGPKWHRFCRQKRFSSDRSMGE